MTRSKFDDTCAEIFRLAGVLGPGGKLPTVAQLCATLQVSVVTLTSALTEMERRRVIVRRRGSGIYVAPRFGQKTVVLLCHPIFFQAGASPFWEVLVQGIARQAHQKEQAFRFHFVAEHDDDPVLQETLLEQIQDGLVQGILGVGLTDRQTAQVEALGVPYVGYAGGGRYTVAQDYEALLRLGVEQLKARGCRTVGLWSFVMPYRSRRDAQYVLDRQRAAVARVWERAGLTLYPELMIDQAPLLDNPTQQTSVSRHEQGYRAAEATFSTEVGLRPDGVVITSDIVARGALVGSSRSSPIPTAGPRS